jgi:hypothetical protein
VYQGSKAAGVPYGATTAESAARKLLDLAGDPDRKNLATSVVVSYDGLFVPVARDTETALLAFGPREVGLVWMDKQDTTLFGIVSHSDDPTTIACHIFRVDQVVRDEVLSELIENLNIASIGRYPGALGVFAAEYGG